MRGGRQVGVTTHGLRGGQEVAARNVAVEDNSRSVENSKLEKEQGEKPAMWQSPSLAEFDKLLEEVGMDLDDEADISKMQPHQIWQTLSACHKALGLAKRKFEETGGYDSEVLELAAGPGKRRRRSVWQTRRCKEWTRMRQGPHSRSSRATVRVYPPKSGGVLPAERRQI